MYEYLYYNIFYSLKKYVMRLIIKGLCKKIHLSIIGGEINNMAIFNYRLMYCINSYFTENI